MNELPEFDEAIRIGVDEGVPPLDLYPLLRKGFATVSTSLARGDLSELCSLLEDSERSAALAEDSDPLSQRLRSEIACLLLERKATSNLDLITNKRTKQELQDFVRFVFIRLGIVPGKSEHVVTAFTSDDDASRMLIRHLRFSRESKRALCSADIEDHCFESDRGDFSSHSHSRCDRCWSIFLEKQRQLPISIVQAATEPVRFPVMTKTQLSDLGAAIDETMSGFLRRVDQHPSGLQALEKLVSELRTAACDWLAPQIEEHLDRLNAAERRNLLAPADFVVGEVGGMRIALEDLSEQVAKHYPRPDRDNWPIAGFCSDAIRPALDLLEDEDHADRRWFNCRAVALCWPKAADAFVSRNRHFDVWDDLVEILAYGRSASAAQKQRKSFWRSLLGT